MMKETKQLFEDLTMVAIDHQVFVIAITSILVTGLALYVVLVAIKSSSGKGG